MKTKVVPTSPKNTEAERDADVEAFMRTSSAIQKPTVVRFSLFFTIIVIVVALIVGFAGAMTYTYGRDHWTWVQQLVGKTESAVQTIVTSTKREAPAEQYADSVSKVQGNVVALYSRRVSVKKNASTLDQLYVPEDFRGVGTLLTEDGIGVTVRQAIPDLTKEIAVVAGGITYTTKNFFPDPASDLVFFRISGKGYPALDFADPAGLIVSQRLLRFGKDPVTQSVHVVDPMLATLNSFPVNARADYIRSSEQFAPALRVQPGSIAPGEPVFTTGGKLVGVHVAAGTAVLSVSTIATGLSRLQETGSVTRNIFGVRYLDLSVASHLILAPLPAGTSGALLTESADGDAAVQAKSPADRAGLKSGDVITRVNDTPLTATSTLTDLIQSAASRATLTITYKRGSTEERVPVTLDITP